MRYECSSHKAPQGAAYHEVVGVAALIQHHRLRGDFFGLTPTDSSISSDLVLLEKSVFESVYNKDLARTSL